MRVPQHYHCGEQRIFTENNSIFTFVWVLAARVNFRIWVRHPNRRTERRLAGEGSGDKGKTEKMLDQVKRDDLRKATLSRNIADDNVFTHAVLSSMSGAFVEFLVTERQAYFRRMCYTSTMTVGQRVC